jgi:hypothetical protein
MKSLALILCLCVGAPAALASPLNPKRIPAEASGVGNIDLDVLRTTSFYGPAQHLQVSPELTKYKPLFEQLLTTCRSISFWVGDQRKRADRDGDSRDGAVLFEFSDGKRARDFVDKLVTLSHATKVGNDRYSVSIDDETFQVAVIDNVVALSQVPDSLTRTIAVAQGKAASLSIKVLSVGSMAHDVFLFVALGGAVLKEIKSAANSVLLKSDMTSLVLSVGERGAEVRARGTAVMANNDEALKVKSLIDGLVALVSLSDDFKPFRPVEKYFKVTVFENKVNCSLVMPSAMLVEHLPNHATAVDGSHQK